MGARHIRAAVVATAGALALSGVLALSGCMGGGGSPWLAKPTPTPTTPVGAEPHVVSDDAGVVQVLVPGAWSEVDDASFTDGNGVGWQVVVAAPSVQAYSDSAAAAGVQVMAAQATGQSAEATFLALAPSFEERCALKTRPGPFADANHVGVYAEWDCEGTSAALISTLNKHGDNVVVILQLASPEEKAEVPDLVLQTFNALF